MPSLSPNQLNRNEITGQENNINTTEQNAQHLSRLQNEIGSKVLALVNFESKHKDIVESSFNKARQNKEKLPGKNNERRNFAYLSRLDNMIEKHGDKVEQKLWEASAENLVMDYEDIPEAYWKQQEQILRDNGQGRKLSEYEKKILAEDLIDKQRQSITSWANYLGDKNCPYPLWFKVYAFDGISKMSNALNLDDADYNRRDNTTALSFPKLNAEILAKVYRQINDFYGVDKENWLAQHSDDEKLVSLVKSANFPKLYAKELVDTKVILKTPERTEDVHGDWFEYKLGDEEEIASLAEGTRWCVVDPNVAHNYLEYGNCGHSRYKKVDRASNSKTKFIIFRLEDPNSPGIFASNGSASVRLGPDGKVAEISGLNEGQAVEDALIPIVKEKTLSLPGGEKYLQKFDDKQTLIKLDNKMKEGEDLTKEELAFLYELDRPIATLDTYNSKDPRITELKEKYDLGYAFEKGIDINKLVSSLDPVDIAHSLDTLLEHGADINVNELASNLGSDDILDNLGTLLRNGADINVNELVSSLDPYYIVNHLDTLLENGADIDIYELALSLDTGDFLENLGTFLEHGADINHIVNNMSSKNIADNLDTLLNHGADIDVNKLVLSLHPNTIIYRLGTLLRNGADINVILSNLKPNQIANDLDTLIKYGANIDINELVSSLDADMILENLDTLLKHGSDVNNIVSNINSSDIAYDLDTLLKYGADIDINELVSELRAFDIAYNLDSLLQHGADIDINELVSSLNSDDIAYHLNILLKHGADVAAILSNLKPNQIANDLDTLTKYGADIDINELASTLDADDLAYSLDTLLKHGADVNLITRNLKERDIKNNIDLLRKYGANLDDY